MEANYIETERKKGTNKITFVHNPTLIKHPYNQNSNRQNPCVTPKSEYNIEQLVRFKIEPLAINRSVRVSKFDII